MGDMGSDVNDMTIDAVRVMRETSVARVEYRSTVDSTNDRAAQCAAQGTIELPLLVVADQQTAGRGRGKKGWWSGPGSLAFSLLVDAKTVAADESRSPLVALATAVAVVDCVAPLLPMHEVGVHWPNDVHVRLSPSARGADVPVCPEYFTDSGRQECLPHLMRLTNDRKLAGILVEVLPDRRHVIGIGLNLNNTLADAPPELRNTAATIRDLTGRQHDRTEVLIDLLGRLQRQFSQLREDLGKVAAAADSRCLQRGQSVTLNWTNRKITGQCRGIAADGAFLLETPEGIKPFLSGSTIANQEH
jgi:BirA family transcriptional regulator, biotin operon repressor / biotin---[acetyl-CoA-carboxylase] ligase